ncbi:hypothetical protein ACX8Z9_04680 [Arthrobacter halodurans]|uniref:Uncharacterized protein n=1 Tax=Arthrobacter halodurans TaxID=516699 RepID=A0ABV4UU43_9MICC
MPGIGERRCERGDAEHSRCRDDVDELAELDVEDGWVTHRQLLLASMELWEFDEVCLFFTDKLADSARTVVGAVAERYRRDDAVDIVGHFSKTWQGCPEAALCEGGYGLPE